MNTYVIKGPSFVWKASPANILSTRMKLFSAIVTEEDANKNLEKIIDYNNLKPIAFLDQGIAVSRPVAHITLADGGMATGFLISQDVLLTNWHVFPSEEKVQGAKIRFNYQTDLYGNFLPSDEYDCDPDSLFKNNENLDYTVVRIKGTPGMKWGFLKLKPIDIQMEDKINIIQHPAGGPKQIAMNDNEAKYIDATVVQYITDTLPGSSGSPVFNDSWEVVALHHSGGNIPEPSTNSIHFRNEGIRIGAILTDMPPF
ncbi:MAG TPA: serine protease [Thermodesulfovibrionales bacterium]|nr:serine protease [Thermodesulfovibrionales bacterium]